MIDQSITKKFFESVIGLIFEQATCRGRDGRWIRHGEDCTTRSADVPTNTPGVSLSGAAGISKRL